MGLYGIVINGVHINVETLEQAVAAVWENLRPDPAKADPMLKPYQMAVEVYIVDYECPGHLIVRSDSSVLERVSEFAGAGTFNLIYDEFVHDCGSYTIKRVRNEFPICTIKYKSK